MPEEQVAQRIENAIDTSISQSVIVRLDLLLEFVGHCI
jgi:hypothetical protein